MNYAGGGHSICPRHLIFKHKIIMKKSSKVILSVLLAAQAASAQSFTQFFTGQFTDGDLSGFTIEGLFEIETTGQPSGTADTDGFGMEINEFDFVVFDLSDNLFTEFLIDDDLIGALATFETFPPAVEPIVTTFDYFGENFAGEFLDFFYDAFASDPSTAFAVSFDDGAGNVSNATLDLATAVPEPSAFAAIAGVMALSLAAMRRRKAA